YLLLHIILFLLVFFFFQAEDGIRDATVTGVQTCALPISFAVVLRRVLAGAVPVDVGEMDHAVDIAGQADEQAELGDIADFAFDRSEERRVGKECRYRWAAGHEKKRVTG